MKNDPWIPTQISKSDEFKERALKLAIQYPAAFRMLPVTQGKPEERGTWALYPFDGVVQIWVDSSHEEALKLYDEILTEKKEIVMTKALTTNEQDTVKQLLAANVQAIKSVLPEHLTPERMLRMAWTSITKSPKLARCSQLSLMNGIIEASMIGLEIGGPMSLAHLVPFNNKRTKTLEATLIVDYKGLIDLMYRSPMVKAITAHPVYIADEFSYEYGLQPTLRHKPETGNRGALEYAYCIVFYTTGGADFEVVDEDVAMRHKAKSAAKDSSDSPWNKKDEVHNMWVKTAVKIISKRVPKSPELIRAIAADSAAERGEQNFDHVIDIPLDDFATVTTVQPKDDKKPAESKTGKPSQKPTTKKTEKSNTEKTDPNELIMKNLLSMINMVGDEVKKACGELKIGINDVIRNKDYDAAQKIIKRAGEIVDSQNQ